MLRKSLFNRQHKNRVAVILSVIILILVFLWNCDPALAAQTESVFSEPSAPRQEQSTFQRATVVNVETSAPLCSTNTSSYQVLKMIWLGRTVDVLEKTTGALYTDYVNGGSSSIWYKVRLDMNGIWYTGYMSSLHLSLIQETSGAPGPTVSGNLSHGMTWKLSAAGVLTVSGNGALQNFDEGNMTDSPGYAPWHYYADYVREIVVANGVTALGEFSFCGCTGCTKVTVADSVRTIGPGSFYGCDALEEVVLPFCGGSASPDGFWNGQFGTVFPEQIQENTLKKVTITKVPPMEQAFTDCPYLETVILPETTTAIPYRCFENCAALKNVSIPGAASTIMGYAFHGCTALTEVTIPGSVEQIGEYAFYECSGLRTVTVGEGCRTIMNSAFNSCALLKSVRLPQSLRTIEDYCFDQDPSLVRMVIPDGVTELGNTFNYCDALNEVTIGSGVRRLCGFFRDPSLKTVRIGRNVEEIEAFRECSALTEIIIPDGVKTIRPFSFQDCTSLKAVIIPDSVTELGNSAFMNCTALTRVEIGNGVEQLDYSAFYGCISLWDLTLGNGLRSIDGFYGCTGLEKVLLPENTTSVDGFNSCTSLRHIDMPNTVTSVTGFGSCPALETVRFHGSRAEWETIEFGQYSAGLRNCTVIFDDAEIPGDVTGDQILDLKDVSVMFRLLTGAETERPALSVCDVNGDGPFSLQDIAVLFRRYADDP